MEDIEQFVNKVRELGVSWLEFHFTDLLGRLRIAYSPIDKLDEKVFEEGIPKLDGSSVTGFGKIEFSDLNLIPDPDTFVVLPWSPAGEKIGRVFPYVKRSLGAGFLETDPRYVSLKLMDLLRSINKNVLVGPEAEFYIFRELSMDFNNPAKGMGHWLEGVHSPWNNQGYPIDFKDGYYSSTHLDKVYEYRYDLVTVLSKSFNIGIVSHHHEVGAASQVEVNIEHRDPLQMSDNYMTLKYVSRNIASKYGYYVTFMPKPIYGDNGSGLHSHISIWEDGENLFYDKDDNYAELSQYARYFIGGLLDHGRSLSAIVSPTVNSYKRLVPGYEAPIYLAWSRGNRSAAIRIPVYRRGEMKSKRIEYRPPDPSINPYLGFAAIILAGLNGVNKKIDPGDPVDKNIYHMTEEEKRSYDIKSLPHDLYEALDELESDHEYLLPIFSSEVIETYIDIKREEFKKISSYPTTPELKYYFSL